MSSHKVSLKVLRLSKPRLPPPDLTKSPIPNTLLALPSSVGSVYIGETLSCIIAANNETDETLEIILSVVLQLPSQNTVILSRPESPRKLGPRESFSHVVHYEARETGLHVVSTTVMYAAEGTAFPESLNSPTEKPLHGEGLKVLPIGYADRLSTKSPSSPVSASPSNQSQFTKHYRFNVSPGVAVRTKLMPVPASDSYSIEAQVENLTDSCMTLETAQILPPAGWDVRSLAENSAIDAMGDASEKTISVSADAKELSTSVRLMPKETWQFGFIMSFDHDFDNIREAVGMGKFSVSWRREPMGEKGWLTAGHLSGIHS